MPTEIIQSENPPAPKSHPGAAMRADVKLRLLLGQLRRAIQRQVILECLSWAVVMAVMLAGISFALDWLVHMATEQRLLALAAGAVVLGSVLWRFLWRPLSHKMKDEDLALVLENQFPQLQDRVITTLELSSKTRGGEGMSAELLDLVGEEALKSAALVSLTEPLNRRRLRKRLLNAAMVAGVFILACVVFPQWMAIWFQRNVLLSNVEWPHQTELTVTAADREAKDNIFRVGSGENLDIIVKASGKRIPQKVRFDLQFANSGRFREEVERGQSDAAQFLKTFSNNIENLEFTVAGGDYQTQKFRIEVVASPQFERLEFICEYPPYTSLPTRKISGDEVAGGVEAVVGTWVTMRAVSSEPLSGGKLLLSNQSGLQDAQPVADLKLSGGKNLEARWQLKNAQSHSGMLHFMLTDKDGFTSVAASYPITALPDREPFVKIQTKGVGERVTPNARVPLEIEASDDYSVSQMLLAYGLRDDGSDAKNMELKDAPKNLRQFTFPYVWEIESLAVKPGQVLSFHAEAIDSADGKGVSPSMRLQIVTAKELLEDIRRQQRLYTNELERLLKRQRETTTATKLSRDRLQANAARPVAEEKQPLQEIVANERDIGNALQNLSEQIARLTNEMENNRLGDASEYNHWREKVVAPLAEVSKQVLGPLVGRQIEAQDAAKAPAAVEKLVAALIEQDAAEAKMERILKDMTDSTGWSDIIQKLRQLIEEGSATEKALDEAYKKKIREILGTP